MPIESSGINSTTKKLFFFIAGVVILISLIVYFTRPTGSDRDEKRQGNRTPGGANETTTGLRADITKPSITSAKFHLESANNVDIIKIIASANDKEGTNIVFNYEWTINDQAVGSNTNSVNGFKKGDKIAVKITPFNGKEYGLPRTIKMEVANTTPKIIDNNIVIVENGVVKYQVKAQDNDGDKLKYELIDGPKGAVIDANTGQITWPILREDVGTFNMKVKVTDGRGGTVEYPFHINVSPSPEKVTAEMVPENK